MGDNYQSSDQDIIRKLLDAKESGIADYLEAVSTIITEDMSQAGSHATGEVTHSILSRCGVCENPKTLAKLGDLFEATLMVTADNLKLSLDDKMIVHGEQVKSSFVLCQDFKEINPDGQLNDDQQKFIIRISSIIERFDSAITPQDLPNLPGLPAWLMPKDPGPTGAQ